MAVRTHLLCLLLAWSAICSEGAHRTRSSGPSACPNCCVQGSPASGTTQEIGETALEGEEQMIQEDEGDGDNEAVGMPVGESCEEDARTLRRIIGDINSARAVPGTNEISQLLAPQGALPLLSSPLLRTQVVGFVVSTGPAGEITKMLQKKLKAAEDKIQQLEADKAARLGEGRKTITKYLPSIANPGNTDDAAAAAYQHWSQQLHDLGESKTGTEERVKNAFYLGFLSGANSTCAESNKCSSQMLQHANCGQTVAAVKAARATNSSNSSKPSVLLEAKGVLSKPEDFRNCKSEGGTWDCAKCDTDGGALPCSLLVAGRFDFDGYLLYGRMQGSHQSGHWESENGQSGPYHKWRNRCRDDLMGGMYLVAPGGFSDDSTISGYGCGSFLDVVTRGIYNKKDFLWCQRKKMQRNEGDYRPCDVSNRRCKCPSDYNKGSSFRYLKPFKPRVRSLVDPNGIGGMLSGKTQVMKMPFNYAHHFKSFKARLNEVRECFKHKGVVRNSRGTFSMPKAFKRSWLRDLKARQKGWCSSFLLGRGRSGACTTNADDLNVHWRNRSTHNLDFELNCATPCLGETDWKGRKCQLVSAAGFHIFQKQMLAKLDEAELTTGWIGLKRLVPHKRAADNVTVFDVMKIGRCIRCPLLDTSFFDQKEHQRHFGKPDSQLNKLAIKNGVLSPDGKLRTVFHSTKSAFATVDELKVFSQFCVQQAFGRNATHAWQKKEYQCPTELPTSIANCSGRWFKDQYGDTRGFDPIQYGGGPQEWAADHNRTEEKDPDKLHMVATCRHADVTFRRRLGSHMACSNWLNKFGYKTLFTWKPQVPAAAAFENALSLW